MAPQLVTRIQRRVAIKSSWLDPPQFGEWFFDPNISAAPEDLHHAWREGAFFSKFAFRFVASLGIVLLFIPESIGFLPCRSASDGIPTLHGDALIDKITLWIRSPVLRMV